MMSLGEALPKEMDRVRDEVMPAYQKIGPVGHFALMMMRDDLKKATEALASGDIQEMIRAYRCLKAYNL
jgi:hypothetical protein